MAETTSTGEPLCVIYALTLDGVNYRYVGMTQIGAEARLRIHLKTGRNPRLPSARWIKKHRDLGADIKSVVLEECTPENVGAREAIWIERLRTEGHALLNLTEGGRGGLPGYVHSPASRAKMSAKRKGQILDAAWRAKIAEAHARRERKPLTEATREKLRAAAARRGPIIISEEQKARQSAAMRGRKLTAEHRAKLSAAQQKRPAQTIETRRKRSETLQGHQVSNEARAKISAARSRYEAERRGLTITEDVVRQIRLDAERGTPIRDLGEQFGLPYNQTWRIAKRRSWSHVQ
ncbi:NUMOD3 domain-containing DNA-binding protein [Kitasatospora sp. NPDC057223]|uniref:NUMOD3 domain-containing DNA-binding protein n=1 Tax=Kitasatospora sp. NPDC057223 TaxID=3346055 RepID=UPI0036266AB4